MPRSNSKSKSKESKTTNKNIEFQLTELSDADDADMLLTFWFTSRDWGAWWANFAQGRCSTRCRGGKVKVSTLLSLCNKDSHNVDADFYWVKVKAPTRTCCFSWTFRSFSSASWSVACDSLASSSCDSRSLCCITFSMCCRHRRTTCWHYVMLSTAAALIHTQRQFLCD